MTKLSYVIKFCLFFLFLFFFNINIQAQCAGQDNTVTICDKELDSSLQNYNLFDQLLGAPEPGGVWTTDSPVNGRALDSNSGILNLWFINNFGTHVFTYTNNSCNESASVTINLGGYAGKDNIDGNANACSDDDAINLYSFLGDDLDNLNVDLNGTWSASGYPSFLSNNIFNATTAGPGIYNFTYTVGAVETCLSKSADITLEVFRAQKPGTALDIIICEGEDLSPYTNINLFDQVIGEDTGGVWSEESTNQLSDLYDSTINIQEIYNTHGTGNYLFTYTIAPIHGVCTERTSIVKVSIPRLFGKFNVEDVCKGDNVNVRIDYHNPFSNTFEHDLEYEIENILTGKIVYTGNKSGINVDRYPDDIKDINNHSFSINLSSLTIGKYIIRAKKINNVTPIICSSLKIHETSFIVSDTKLSTDKTCFNDEDVTIKIDNLVDNTGRLANDNYTTTYTVEDLTNNITKEFSNQTISFTNGATTLPIDISIFPKNARNYNLKFIEPKFSSFSCVDFIFTAALVPREIELNLLFDDECDTKNISLDVNTPDLGDGNYTITYQINKKNQPTILLEQTIVVAKETRKVDNIIDITSLGIGNYQILLKSTQNDTNPCKINSDFEILRNFSIGGIPNPPILDKEQVFCLANASSIQPTIKEIKVDEGSNLIWYENLISTTPLPLTTTLINDEDYFVVANDPENDCEHSERSIVTIKINKPSIITSNNTNPVFCNSNNSTIENLNAKATSGDILWYDSLTDGNLLSKTTALENGKSYFAVESIKGCESTERLQFTVTITTPSIVKSKNTNPAFCTLKNSTLKNLDATALLGNLLWYDALVGGNLIPDTTPLQDGESYFAVESIDGCQHHERLEFVITTTLPTIKSSTTNPVFCGQDNYTIENLDATAASGNLLWYDSLTDGNLIPPTTTLENGKSYFAVEENFDTCKENKRLQFNVTIIKPSLIIAGETNPTFCISDNFTLENLDATAVSGKVLWYDSLIDGNLIASTTILENGKSYFAVENINGCEYKDRLPFNINIITPPKPEFVGNGLLCVLDKKTILDLESNIVPNPDYNLVWHDALIDGTEIDKSTILREDTTYFTSFIDDLDMGCEGERQPIKITLSACEPTTYKFFIPDGFSPNNDGVNDLYYIPNVEIFYPKYELEIFNRYGQSIFKVNASKPAWDGTNSKTNNNATSGVYFYVLKYHKDNLKPKQGRLYLSK